MVTSEDDASNLKSEVDWTKVEDDEALANSKALNGLHKWVNKGMLKLINTCWEDKKASEILTTATLIYNDWESKNEWRNLWQHDSLYWKCIAEGQLYYKDLTDVEIASTCRLLVTKWEEAWVKIKKHNKTISELH